MNYIKDYIYKIANKKFFKMTPARMISLGFIALIIFGAVLLYLPVSSNTGKIVSFTDALFTAVSSVCVTGLVVTDTNVQWSFFGKAIILMLIQTGALGIMSVVTLFSLLTGKKLGLKDRLTMQESINNFTLEGIVKTFKSILIITVIIEAIGALIVSIELIPVYGVRDGLAKSIFHSVSAFCNAGFDTFGTETNKFTSLVQFSDRPLMLITTSFLVIIGSLGFIVWSDIAGNRKFSRFTLHSKLVLITSVSLIIYGTISFLIFEYNNPGTMGNMSLPAKLLNSFFQSVTTRSAGFNTLPLDQMNDTSNFLTIVLMFIGGASGSTAGGIKVTTLSVIVLTVITFSKGREDVQAFGRRIPISIITKSVSIIALGTLIIMVVAILLLLNNEGSFFQALFEAVSAFGTTGLSTGITPRLSTFSKYMFMITIILGRIGPFTAVVAFASMQNNKKITYRYPEGKITVG